MDMHGNVSDEVNPVTARSRSQQSERGGRHSSVNTQRDSTGDEVCSNSDRDPVKDAANEKEVTQGSNGYTCGHDSNNNLVDFDGPNDPDNPKNFPKWRKWAITTSMGFMTFAVTFSSSIFSVAVAPVAEEFHISTVASTMGVALFLFVRHERYAATVNCANIIF
jgi:DHA1 family multidrug resistance protein-like MFS transporter